MNSYFSIHIYVPPFLLLTIQKLNLLDSSTKETDKLQDQGIQGMSLCCAEMPTYLYLLTYQLLGDSQCEALENAWIFVWLVENKEWMVTFNTGVNPDLIIDLDS